MKKTKALMKRVGTEGVDLSTAICLYDQLTGQLDRMSALADLLISATEEIKVDTLVGVGWLLKDLHGRMETILDETRRKISAGS